METDQPPLKWSSRERSVPEVSLINDSSLKCQPNNFEFMPTFEPLIRKDFPLCSSPPVKSAHEYNDSPKFITPSRPQWTPEAIRTPNLDAFKTELLTALISHQSNQFDIFKSDFLNNVRKEQKAEIDEIKKGISLIKSELSNILPSIKHEFFGMLEKIKMESKIKPVEKAEVGLQVELERQDQSNQTEEGFSEPENCQKFQDQNEEYRRPVPRKPHEGFELRLVNDYEKQSSNDRNVQNVRQTNDYDSDNSESDDVDDRLSPLKRPMKQYPPDCDMVQVDERYSLQGPNQRGGFARVQELRMAGVNRNHHRAIPPEPPQCTDISMATNAVLAKYLPPEKVAECQTPRRQQQPAQDVVFNMTNVSFAMRYPAENDSPDVGNYIYPPQNRHLKPNRYQDDRYDSEEHWKTRNQRRIIEEDEWPSKPPRDILRQQPDWDRFHHGMNKENGMAPGYQEEYNYGRRDGFIRENNWGRGVPYRENFNGRRGDPNWENGNNFPMQGRGQPPINNRILDITAIKNQPKLT